MCGITGFIDFSQELGRNQLQSTVAQMTKTLILRGPDSEGVWVDPEAGLALGHRRLSVIDLSPEGNQPMTSSCGRYVIVFNGEIYNHKGLRRELESLGIPFRGSSDTEVMLAAIIHWENKGEIHGAIQKFNGMFAFALWDRHERKLYLVRDRFGEKPLYYGWNGRTFFFGSELKSFFAHPDFHGEINRDALALYLRYNYIPSPYSIYQGIYKLLPGSVLTISCTDKDSIPSPVPYWSFLDVAQTGINHPLKESNHEACEHLEMLLRNAVKMRMEADVPHGAFLSGGIDSSTVVALMQAQSTRPVKTFTIGFYEAGYNEAVEAKAIAKHLGTEHTELYITPEEAMSVIPLLPNIYDEPFSDSSQIPTYLVSKLARKDVTVSLSGDGSDELFGGYPRYTIGSGICNGVGWLPQKTRHVVAKCLFGISRLPFHSNDKLKRLGEILSVEGEEVMYREMVSHLNHPTEVVLNSTEPDTIFSKKKQWIQSRNITQRMMYIDTLTYLPDDILAKVDRASMAVSLESRMPFLDHHLVEHVWSLPISLNAGRRGGKRLLRQILSKYVPPKLFERPKMGFGVPIDSWLRGPLREWGENLLDKKRLKDEGFFESRFIREKWDEHISGRKNRHYFLWTVLMFQAWLETREKPG